MTQKIKICTKCKKELPATLEYFYYSKLKYTDGLRYWCKNCCQDYKREHRRETVKNRKEYHKKNSEERYSLERLHVKVTKLKPKQEFCSICNQEKKLELSSVNGIYSEDPNDYWWLCHACHHLYDRVNKTHKKEVKK